MKAGFGVGARFIPPWRRWISLCLAVGFAGATASFAASSTADAKAWKRHQKEGRAAVQKGDARAALQAFEAAVREAEGFGPDDHRLAESLSALAETQAATGRFRQAEPLLRRALAIQEKNYGPDSLEATGTLLELADVSLALKNYSEAETLARRMQPIVERKLGKFDPRVGVCRGILASATTGRGRLKEGEALYREALKLADSERSKVVFKQSYDPAFNPMSAYRLVTPRDYRTVSKLLVGLVVNLKTQERFAEAEAEVTRATEIIAREYGRQSLQLAYASELAAEISEAQGKPASAIALLEQTVAIREKVSGAWNPEWGGCWCKLADLYLSQNRASEAEARLQQVLSLQESALGPQDPALDATLEKLVQVKRRLGKQGELEPLYRRLIAIEEKRWGPDRLEVADALTGLADLYLSQGKYSEAEPLYLRAVAAREKSRGGAMELVPLLSHLGEIYERSGNTSQREQTYQKQLVQMEKLMGPNHVSVAKILEDYAQFLRRLGRAAQAEPLEARAKTIRAAQNH